MTTAQLLMKLSDMDIISGCEKDSELIDTVAEYLDIPANTMSYDKLSNLIIPVTEEGRKHILLEAHADETGFIVTSVTENGFIKIAPVGGTYSASILGSVFTVYGKEKLTAVAVTVPPHLSNKDKTELPDVSDILLDAGLSGEKAKELISAGDRVLRKVTSAQLSDTRITGKALDNRAGVAVLLIAARKLVEEGTANKITLAFTSMEEVGCRGAYAAGNTLSPDEAICVDVSFATQPNVSKDEAGELSKGPMIGISPMLSRDISKKLTALCENNSIPYQIEVMAGRTGTTADVLQISGKGIPCALISIPQRNMHSSCETVDTEDIENIAALVAAYCKD